MPMRPRGYARWVLRKTQFQSLVVTGSEMKTQGGTRGTVGWKDGVSAMQWEMSNGR